ncbi:hypothetical protein, partial [Serratia marcescens]
MYKPDPTLTRSALLLTAFAVTVTVAAAAGPAAPADVALAAKAQALFGKQPGQSFDASAFTASAQPPRTETQTLT